MKTIVKNTLSLTAFTLVMGILLGVVHYVTAEPIRLQEQKKVEEVLKLLIIIIFTNFFYF